MEVTFYKKGRQFIKIGRQFNKLFQFQKSMKSNMFFYIERFELKIQV